MSTLTFDSSRFGTLEIPAEDVIVFPAGLIGLGGRRYAIVATDDSAFSWLHSIDDPTLALPVTNPWQFFSDYEVDRPTRRLRRSPPTRPTSPSS